ncbi:MAG: winged helix DNA-binding protein [Desulfurococcales archaeon]|nr:winged helix DNA-binding protein [Desulfurococcales archaeon]
MPRKRTRIKIIMDIMKHLSERSETPTRLATLANIPYDRLIPILEELERKGLVVFEASEENPRARTVKLTDKGWKLYLHLKKLFKVVKDFGLEIL